MLPLLPLMDTLQSLCLECLHTAVQRQAVVHTIEHRLQLSKASPISPFTDQIQLGRFLAPRLSDLEDARVPLLLD